MDVSESRVGRVEAPASQPENTAAARGRGEAESARNLGADETPRLHMDRTFTREGVHPFDEIEWERRTAEILDEKGEVIFRQEDVEVPQAWSMLATNVVASKYFYGEVGTPQREYSVRQLVHRVARTIADWGWAEGVFATERAAEIFYQELCWLCVRQYGSFNSPVWFNVGLHQEYGTTGGPGNWRWHKDQGAIARIADNYVHPQASACFIQSVTDTMESIMGLATAEAMLFKYGSGTGTDLSPLRSAREKLAGGGRPSGPISFMRVYDQVAAVVKSGGKTRRAAKMQSLKVRHPDIEEFITAKQREEKKAWTLIDAGYDGSYNGEAYSSVMFQNSNFSVRITDEFMKAVEEDLEWVTHAVTTGEPMGRHNARDLWTKIGEGTWLCGDPGVQYDTTINRWHTCPNTAPINASNPCSEYMFIDDSACNLASLNLMRFRRDDGAFDADRFRAAVETFIIAQEILVDSASYPTRRIAQNSHDYRPLGLGYANLGSLIMSEGLPYDSDRGRAFAGAVTALMHSHAYLTSSRLARVQGPFEGYESNREPMLEVMEMHRAALDGISAEQAPANLLEAARAAWDACLASGRRHGYRNAQVTVLAPTGTIGFMMDCDTTGVEPDIALVKYKLLAGGGLLKIINRTVPMALARLGYGAEQVKEIQAYIEENDTIEGAPHLHDRDLPVFDCAFRPANGMRSIHYMAHLRMMAAVQPFLSGAISKTVNMPEDSTVEDVCDAYLEGWKLGLKAVAIYRDGSKRSQPVSTRKNEDFETRYESSPSTPKRRRMPSTRRSVTHKFEIAGHEGYLTVGLYEDGRPGELFITMAKEGSTIGGLMDCFGTAISLCLQYGAPLEDLVQKFAHTRFEPSGFTKNRDIPIAKSITDYIFRWMATTFSADPRPQIQDPWKDHESGLEDTRAHGADKRVNRPVPELAITAEPPQPQGLLAAIREDFARFQDDAPPCDLCGAITVRNGTCYRCYNCGNSMGCS